MFDRLSAFEEWLTEPALTDAHTAATPPQKTQTAKSTFELSKNKREQLQREVTELEEKIAEVEGELAELELCFQNPATGTDWETTHKRYADLKVILEDLYKNLASLWELMG